MGATLVLLDTAISAEPGEETSCDVLVRNSGDVVDQFTIDVVGDAGDWATVDPPVLNLLPGDEATAQVVFKPPRSSEVAAGVIPFGIRVRSREDPYASAVEQGDVEVAPFAALDGELVPATRRGRRHAKYQLVIDNNGNHELPIQIVGIDQEDQLDIEVDSPSLLTAAGTASIVKTKVVPFKRFWRGESKTYPFQLLAQAVSDEDEVNDVVTVDGVMIQDPMLPKWFFKAMLIALAAVVALVVLWFALLKPTVESVAREQAAASADEAAKRADDAAERADVAAAGAEAATGGGVPGKNDGAGGEDENAGEPAGGEDGNAGGAAGSEDGADSGQGGHSSTNFRIQAEADPVGDGSFTAFHYTAPDDQVLNISDLVLQNPRGDSGFLRIALDGEVILEVGLANFRDLDYHYVVPLRLGPGKRLAFLVNCESAGSGTSKCTPAVSFSGRLTKSG